MKPELMSSRSLYEGRIFDVTLDRIAENGGEYDREVVHHKGSAVIVPLFADGTVALVRQYRHPAERSLLEIPAGSLNTGEDPQLGAERELEEEIGVRAGKIEKLAEFWVSPGFLTEKMFLYLATDLIESHQNLEDDEHIELERIPLSQAVAMALSGEIPDAKTIIGLLLTREKHALG
jgi:ADP-ribose pyrophosphatase